MKNRNASTGNSHDAPYASVYASVASLLAAYGLIGSGARSSRLGIVGFAPYTDDDDATITWGITEKSVESLWKQYKTFGDARRDFVTPQALGAANTAFDGYNPFSGLDEKNADNPYVPLAEWSKKITEALRPLYAARNVELIGVQVTKVAYDSRTEDKLRQYADAVANTRIKAQDVRTAEQEAAASKARAQTAAPGCEALIRDLASQDRLKDLPAGWQCPGVTGPSVVSAK